MRQWCNGVGNAPRHYAGTRSATGRALSRTRSLTAAAIAVAMMATVAVTSLLPTYNAKADESGLKDGSTCTPSSIGLGDDMSVEGSDTGVATYVGGDMYVGGKENSDLNGETGPAGTYAVEAEGLTVVNGSLAMHPLGRCGTLVQPVESITLHVASAGVWLVSVHSSVLPMARQLWWSAAKLARP